MADTAIEWADRVWNPTSGCDRVSLGCDHCYAMTMAKRLKGMGQAKYQRDGDPRTSGPGFGVSIHPDALPLPLKWRKPKQIFVNSMSDLFHDQVPDEYIARVFAVMACAYRHTFQILTKRHARMRSLLSSPQFVDLFDREFCKVPDWAPRWPDLDFARPEHVWHLADGPLSNVWLGVSAENQQWAKIRGDALRETPAAVRFYSFEPLLGPIDDANLDGIHWVITGGESGPGARPAHPDSPGRKRARTRVDYARRTEEWERDTYDRLKAKFEGAKDNTKMSDDITDQADRVLRLRWEQPGPDYPEPVPTGLVWLGDWASEHLGELVAELKTTRQFRYQVADALGFVECVEGVGNAIIADDVTILDYVRAQAETARKHETECPVWCDDHEHFEHALSCKECGGSGCGPGTATGAHEGCDECGGDGRDHAFAYVHAPDVEAELKTTRAQLETLRAGLTRVEHFARIQALSERVRTGPAHSTYHCEERYWLDLLALIERAEVTDV